MICLVSAHELALGVEAGVAERGGLRVSGRRRAAHRAVLHAEGLHLGRMREHNRRGENAAGRAQVRFGNSGNRENGRGLNFVLLFPGQTGSRWIWTPAGR